MATKAELIEGIGRLTSENVALIQERDLARRVGDKWDQFARKQGEELRLKIQEIAQERADALTELDKAKKQLEVLLTTVNQVGREVRIAQRDLQDLDRVGS